ncbi:MAG: 3-deoxy-7-phosphoheptulonate synthase [Bacteroidaceae bacterium]|nr:3-deoxy-7-phosphoheptulonate synthase [Bacteroidaceae bacterium]
MIAVLKQGVNKAQREQLIQWIEAQKVRVHVSEGEFQTVIGLIGDTSRIDIDLLASLEIVEKVSRVSEPFKSASRRFHPDDTIVEVGEGENKVKIGGGNFCMIAGPCSVESEEQIITVAKAVKEAGAKMLRGGAFKPRTSPYDFQGLRGEGLELLMKARKETGLPIVTEIMNAAHLDMFADVDIIQVGARNMQNFELLKELGRSKKPILLKRGLAATLKEFLMSAEYILAEGNENVMLCERGIRSFDTYTRNVLDLASVPMLHELSHLPVVVDPSHATGVARLVKPMACAATVAGADALIIEVHNNPPCALCDGAQSLTPAQFAEVAERVEQMRTLIQK